MVREYWVNVYDQNVNPLYLYSGKHANKQSAERVAAINNTYSEHPLLYRLHVKIKEPKPKYEFPELADLMPCVYSQAEV